MDQSKEPFAAIIGARAGRPRREPSYPLLPMAKRGEQKAASVAERYIRFSPRTYPNLATGATATARARTVLRAAETLAPARKRHWTAEIADIVADVARCGYEPVRFTTTELQARARRITFLALF